MSNAVTLPSDRMPEAEVSLLLAEYLLSLPDAERTVSVAIDGAGVSVDESFLDVPSISSSASTPNFSAAEDLPVHESWGGLTSRWI